MVRENNRGYIKKIQLKKKKKKKKWNNDRRNKLSKKHIKDKM